MKIIVLTENTTANKELKKQHGLSLYIETTKHKLLVDTGDKNVFLKNAKKLGVDISAVDTVIITHGHYDHAGGLKHFLKANNTAKVFIQRSAFMPHYMKRFGLKINIGADKRLEAHKQIILADGDLQIDKELSLIVNPQGKELLPKQSKLLKKENGEYAQDDFAHEQSLIIADNKTLLISGCSHRGIVNILEKAKTKTDKAVDVCIGAFHFFKLPPNDSLITQTAERLNKENTAFYTCHCTGVKQYEELNAVMGGKIKYLATGQTIEI